MANIPRLRAVLMHNTTGSVWIQPFRRGILEIYHKPPSCLIAFIKLITNVIRAVKNICFVIPVVYGLIYHVCQPISIRCSNHSVYNQIYYMTVSYRATREAQTKRVRSIQLKLHCCLRSRNFTV